MEMVIPENVKYVLRPDVNYVGPDDGHIMARMAMMSDFDPETVEKKMLDVQYGTLPEQILDVYYPSTGEGPYPVIFFVHGGAWIYGNKRGGTLSCVSTALKRGYVLISVDYRLAPATKFPENLYDVKTAVRWARANAEKYNFDPDKFAMAGDSAGGYFALMVAATANIPAFEGEKYGYAGVSSELQAVVDYFGPVDMTREFEDYYAESGVKCIAMRVEGEPIFEEQEFCCETAPSLAPLVCPDSYVTKNYPPTILLHGHDDSIVPYQHSVMMAEKIKAVCGDDRAELLIYPERNHEDIDFLCEKSSDICVDFLDRVFGR